MYEIEDGIHDFQKMVWCYADESDHIKSSMQNMWYVLTYKGWVHWLLQIQKGRDYDCFMHFMEKAEHESLTYSSLMDVW